MRKIILFSLMTIMLTGVAFGQNDAGCNGSNNSPAECVSDIGDGTVLGKRVLFCTNKTGLDEACKNQMGKENIKNFCTNGKVVLIGSASRKGGSSHNTFLSNERVRSVSNYIKDSNKVYMVTAAGESNAEAAEKPEDNNDWKDRSVHIVCARNPDDVGAIQSAYDVTLNLNFDTTINVSADADVVLIEKAEEIDKIIADLGAANKWRTEDGKFNTARLMTDLGAGVVLGTVGGVVTSVLMKKKQVEDGFENLKCTVGGQVVGSWGDTFKVGFKQ